MSKPSNRPEAVAARTHSAEIARRHGCAGGEVSLLRMSIGLWLGNTGFGSREAFRDLVDEVFADVWAEHERGWGR